ncbi:MAG TPA: hypothetical protein VJ521_09170, partial [Acidobacteriota bacterium]|nr:hypothetical protein [Acidobacteriota bacterium]
MNRFRFSFVLLFTLFLTIRFSPDAVQAQKWPDEEGKVVQGNFLTGKIYDFDRKWFLTEYVVEVKNLWVRAV